MTVLDGLLLVDKPTGPTSHDVVALAKRRLGAAKVGHAGTLDPMASGLLPLAIGRATRLIRFLPSEPKVYAGTLQLGLKTSTDDVTGDVLSRHEGSAPSGGEVLTGAAGLTGRILQAPPAYSARKVAGERMYRIARRGEVVEGAPVEVEVSRFDLAPTDDPWVWSFAASVSSGTYIRALARDLGAALGCGGTLRSLRRTAVGPFRVDDAITLDADATVGRSRLVPLESIPLALPDLAIDAEAALRFAAGIALPCPEADGWVRVLSPTGLAGVGDVRGGVLAPRVVVC